MTSTALTQSHRHSPGMVTKAAECRARLCPQEHDFLQLLSTHHAQKRPELRLNDDLCALARARAARELPRREPESIVLYIWNPRHSEEQSIGIVASRTLLPKDQDCARNAMNAILENTADGRHLLAWNKYYQSQTHVGVGYAADPGGETGCYVFLTATPDVID